MARADYDDDRFDRRDEYQPPFEDSYASIDDAGPIGTSIDRALPRTATRCYFDEEGDLVYGEEVPISVWTETLWLPLPKSGGKFGGKLIRALVFETTDRELVGHTITYTAFPDSRNDRGYARLKRASHHKEVDKIWDEIDGQVLKGDRSIAEIIDSIEYDLWPPNNRAIRGYSLEPLQEGADAFSYRRASGNQYEKSKEYASEGDFDRLLRENLPPALAAKLSPAGIYLYGIVEDYQEAINWLGEHPEVVELSELAANGGIFIKIKSLTPWEFLPWGTREQAVSILTVLAHNVLCGTWDPEKFRGFVRSNRNQSLSCKQTLLTHLRFRFQDLLNNHRRRLPRIDAHKESGNWDVSQQPNKPEAFDERTDGPKLEAFSEQVDRLKSCLSEDPQARNDSDELVATLRSKDQEEIVNALAEIVALHELGKTDSVAIRAIHALNANLADFDDAIQKVLLQAVARLPQA